MKLAMNALVKFLCGLVLMGLLLFPAAGTMVYPGAWLLLGCLFGPMLVLGVVLLMKAPALLQKRLNSKEKHAAQKGVVALSGVLFLVSFVLSGLDFRLGWSRLPWGVSIGAAVVLLLAYGMYAEVMRENAYLSRTVEVQQGQKVIDTGLYGIIRHPMYTATIFLFLAMPLVLGSWVGFAVMLPYPAALVVRIRDEEALLERELDGYRAYKQKVKYRLLPLLW